ncbi:MAG: DUF294 nucleotidyltransferase-like domain-containing protein [Gammaproteobacteria bacterium]|nr:DUF294 nucleotidyltransferase-like domain-containing protein [Gammaproteobacteria bacterium]
MPGRTSPSNATPLAALPIVVLDFETTGLDVKKDRIVQIGAVAMQGTSIFDSPRIDRLINPGIPIPLASSRIHGINDADVDDAGGFIDIVEELKGILNERVVVGHHIAFDLALLRHETTRYNMDWQEPPSLDLALLAGALEPQLIDLDLENIATWLGIKVTDRHTALGDCLSTAKTFTQLIPRLLEADVRTLGEARTFSQRRNDLLLQREQAGWNVTPGEKKTTVIRRPISRIDSHIYARRLQDFMQPPVSVSPRASLREAARVMSQQRVGSVLVLGTDNLPIGILTERDILSAVAGTTKSLDESVVEEIMASPVECMGSGEMLYRALGRMTRKKIRHLCIVDTTGAAIGMVSQRDLVKHRASAANLLGDELAEAQSAAELARTHGKLAHIAHALAEDNFGGIDVARIVSNEVRALTARAAGLAATHIEANGYGPAPALWCVMVLGSGGRGESLLSADQDNALIHRGTSDDDEWFAALGKRMSEILDEAGIPFCDGGVMASNAIWRGTLEQWRERINSWLLRANPKDLLNVDIFYDMIPVTGERAMANELHRLAVIAAASEPPFLAWLTQSVAQMGSPLGLFGQLRSEQGRIDLKRNGLLPIVSIARVMALRIGSTVRSTPDRLQEAAARGGITAADAERMIATFRNLLTLIMKQQIVDLEDGVRPSSRVALNTLGKRTKTQLKDDLRRLEEILSGLRNVLSN